MRVGTPSPKNPDPNWIEFVPPLTPYCEICPVTPDGCFEVGLKDCNNVVMNSRTKNSSSGHPPQSENVPRKSFFILKEYFTEI